MKRLMACALLFSAFLFGCSGKNGSDHHEHELEAQSVTMRGQATELFNENRPLVAGQETRFAVHLTKLSDFKALTEGRVELIFTDKSGQETRFAADAPSNPGIFRPVAKMQTGSYGLKLVVSGSVNDTYDLGQVRVYEDEHDAAHDAEEGEEAAPGISFLKEQQWKVDFNVEEVGTRELSFSLKTYGQVVAPSEAAVPVVSPVDGVIEADVDAPPLFRASVTKGQKLATVRSEDGPSVEIEAPFSGVASRVHLTSAVRKGARIFEIADLSKVWVEAQIYEADIEKAGKIESAIVQIPGSGRSVPTNRLVGEGGVFNAASRTLPVLFEVDNADGAFRVGGAVTVHVRTSDGFTGPAVPKSAVVDEDGRPVVYVQTEGESFERRPIAVAVTDGDWIGVKEGLKEGEWVVTKGAYLLRLASSSSQVPAHGHVH